MYQPSGRCAGDVADDRDGFTQVRALGRFVHLLVADPAQAMAGDLVAEFYESGRRFRMSLQRHRNCKDRERHLALLERAQHRHSPAREPYS